jgi:hypothetical protein
MLVQENRREIMMHFILLLVYKKHYPPILTDNIWRLKNIGKDGPIDKRLESEGVKNVQDFLKLNTMDPDKLKNVSIILQCTYT